MISRTEKQAEAIEKLSRLKVGALFMSMGTGKTRVALDLISEKIHKVDYVLWICPYSLKKEIEDERQKWHPELQFDVVGCESIGSSDRIYMETLQKVKAGKSFIVVDESLKIKNLRAKRTKRILEMGRHSEYRLILNGTPLSRNVLDIYAQMEFLSPKILGMTFLQFKDTYCEYYNRGKLKGKVRKEHNIEHLVSVIEPYIFEADLKIPREKHYSSAYYYVDPDEYAEKKNELFEMYFDLEQDDLNFYAFSTGLQKYYTQCEDKKKKLDELIEGIDGQVIVYVKYLDSIPDGALSITGAVTGEERSRIKERFRSGESKVLYITYGCGAFGLNLQFCHNTIFADGVWDYALLEQAEGRTYRTGQTEDVYYYNLYCGNSGLEDMIMTSIEKKGNLLRSIKQEIQNQKGGIKEWLKSI